MKSQSDQGLSSSFPARQSCAMADDTHWGSDPALYPWGQRNGRSREADPSGGLGHVQVSFISYHHSLGRAAVKLRPRTGAKTVRAV